MPATGTAPTRLPTAAPSVTADHASFEPKPLASARAREAAHCFFWIVALATLNSLFTIRGSHIHRFTGFGVTAMTDTLAHSSGSRSAAHVIVNCWLAGGFLLLGFCAAEGRKWAFEVGMAAYAVDGALLIAAGDYLSAALHAGILYAIYRGFIGLSQPSSSEPSGAASAAHAR